MSNLIQIQEGAKSYGSRALFEKATFAVNEGEHVGVIGPNGAGKTTLFKILVGKEELDSGIYVKAQKLRLGYLAQEEEWEIHQPLEDYLSENCSLPIWELKQLGKDIGLLEEHFKGPIRELSGGFRMRSQLLYIIGCEPNLMLLDEPTNYLDLESLIVLENFLIRYKGAFLLISHDRQFLKRVTNHILEVESQDITKYPGDIDDYFEQKAMIREQLEKQNLSAAARRKKIMDFVTKFGAKATKAKQAQSKMKQLKKIDSANIKALPVTARIRLPEPIQTGKEILQLTDVDLGYGEKKILQNVNMRLVRGDHLGVVGVNGAGKSTLLKALAGELEPFTGKMEWGSRVSTSYFAQHVPESLDLSDTVYSALMSEAPSQTTPQEVLDIAGSLLFSNSDIEKKISVLSGGEKSRVALGQILLKRAPFLILDEPTNHLDFNTVEALTQALSRYSGTIIVVSHDRGFIGRVASKVLEINLGQVALYPGSYDEYVWSVENGVMGASQNVQETASSGSPKETPSKPSIVDREERKKLRRDLRDVDSQIQKLELKVKNNQERLKTISSALSGLGSGAGKEMMDLAFEAENLSKLIQEDEAVWMKLLETKDILETKI